MKTKETKKRRSERVCKWKEEICEEEDVEKEEKERMKRDRGR